MMDDSDLGAESPSGSLDLTDRYDGAYQGIEASFFGSTASTTQAASTWLHSFTYNATRTARPFTLAFEQAVGSVMEYATCVATGLTINVERDQYVTKSVEWLADKQTITGTTTSTAALAALNHISTKKVLARGTDAFLINPQAAGALSLSDRLSIVSAEIQFSYEMEPAREINGTSALGSPISTGGEAPLTAQITVTLRANEDNRFWDAARAGTEYKCALQITSDQMAGGSIPYYEIYRFPRVKLMQDPQWNLENVGENSVTLVFSALVATSTPTGMNSVYPHKVVCNKTAQVWGAN